MSVHARKQGFSAGLGIVMVVFVTLVGVLGYQYAMNYKATVANTSSSEQIAAETMTAPEITSVKDLSKASDALDKASVDDISLDELENIEQQITDL